MTAAQEVKAKYPRFLYEPSVGAGMVFIQQHGAELVTNLAHGRLFNPGHPFCCCAVAYEEIPGTNLTAQQDDVTINPVEENTRTSEFINEDDEMRERRWIRYSDEREFVGDGELPIDRLQHYVCPRNPFSTIIHELFHWQDAYEYRKTGGVIFDAATLDAYTIKQRNICEEKLIQAGVDLADTYGVRRGISVYAESRIGTNDFEEILAEYRTKQLLERR